jgi:hypothetical protein
MKIRPGFVSNSSSSSFVILGYDISKNKAAKKIIETHDKDNDGYCWDIEESIRKDIKIKELTYRTGGEETGLDEGAEVLGLLISEVSSDGGGDGQVKVSLPELQKKLDILKEKFDIVEELCIFSGIRAS